MFTVVEDAYAILACKGVYRQVKVFERETKLYAASGSGFVALYSRYRTSVPTLRWEEVSTPFEYGISELGRLIRHHKHEGKEY